MAVAKHFTLKNTEPAESTGGLHAFPQRSVATAAAVIAVASLGYLMLTGRVDVRRGAEVVLGCFILFGASSIAAGIRGAGSSVVVTGPEPAAALSPAITTAAPAQPEASQAAPFDPYAGASVPAG